MKSKNQESPAKLIVAQRSSIDIGSGSVQVRAGAEVILSRVERGMSPAAKELHLRAAQARRIAEMLSPGDAEILLAFAEECEAEVARLREGKLPIAA